MDENTLPNDVVVAQALAAINPTEKSKKLRWVKLDLLADGTVRWDRESYAPE